MRGNEIFALPCDKEGHRFVISIPLRRLAFWGNRELVAQLQAYFDGDIAIESLSGKTREIIETILCTEEGEVEDLRSKEFRPTNLALFPTSDCNLACRYCYARGGEKKDYLGWKVAKQAVDFIVRNALDQGLAEVKIDFHGNGEPTLHWALITQVVQYASRIEEEVGLRFNFALTTNGVINPKKLEWVVNHIQRIILSFDGPPEIQNRQRPLKKGSNFGSYEYVARSARFIEVTARRYTIRITVTEESVAELPRVLEFFCENFPKATLHLEPVFLCGRAFECGVSMPSSRSFMEKWLEGERITQKHKKEVFYSPVKLGSLRNSFCGVTRPNFCITPQGLVTACFSVCTASDKLAPLFIYGYYDRSTGSFVIDHEKIVKLQEYALSAFSNCQYCFCKYSCSGGCLHDRLNTGGESRCLITRELTRIKLLKIVESEQA